LARVRWSFHRLSPSPAPSLSSSRIPSPISGPRRLALESLTSWQPDGKLRYACDPCPIMARSEPPGRLRSSTGPPYSAASASFSQRSARVSLFRSAPGLSPSRVGRCLETYANASFCGTVAFQPHGSRTNVWASLRDSFADVAQRRVLVCSQPLIHSG